MLDEPTSGLDPLMEAAFRECVEEERQAGRTVLLSSHILSEVEALCDRVTIIREGRTVDSGALADLRHLSRTSVHAEVTRPPDGLAGLPGVHDLDISGDRVSCQVDNDALIEVLARLVAAGVTSILNFAPLVLSVPDGVDVRKVDLSIELQILAFHAQRRNTQRFGQAADQTAAEA